MPLVLLSLVSFPSWGLSMDDLVQREGLYYEKFTDVPFTGEIDEGLERGAFKNGKKEGAWVAYHKNGGIFWKGEFKNGTREGQWVTFWENGQLKSKGEFMNGLRMGQWVSFKDDDSKDKFYSGLYLNDKKVSH